MSDSVWPHRRQPTRFPHPWDSPGKNTGVGCHCLLQCMKVKSESEVTQSCPTLSDPMDCSLPGSSVHGIFQARVLEWGATAFSKRLLVEQLIATRITKSHGTHKVPGRNIIQICYSICIPYHASGVLTVFSRPPGELLSLELHRVGHDWSDLAAAARQKSGIIQDVSSLYVPYNYDWTHNEYYLSSKSPSNSPLTHQVLGCGTTGI